MRIIGKGKTAVAIKERFDSSWFDDNDHDSFDPNSSEPTVISPGVPPHNKLVASTINPISDLDIIKPPYSIWISGTNGKTTTTSMVELLLKNKGAICGGNIGTPVVQLDEKAKIWVLEVSSFTIHYTTKAIPNIYLLLPITPDHISWHGSFEAYKQTKLKPLKTMGKQSIAILPETHKHIKTQAKTIYYKNTKELAKKYNIDTSKINFKEPFLFDAVISLVVSILLDQKPNYKLLNSFKQDNHKIERITDKKGRVWINDSKATNIDATIQAIKTFKSKKIYLILGGDDKDVNMTTLFDFLKDLNIELFCIGKSSQKIHTQLSKRDLKTTQLQTLQNAVKHIDKLYQDKNDIAILSPACSSFDQFDSYKQRGEKFKQFVFELS